MVFLPAVAVLLMDGLVNDSTDTVAMIATLASWESAYFFLYFCLRICRRVVDPLQLAGPRR